MCWLNLLLYKLMIRFMDLSIPLMHIIYDYIIINFYKCNSLNTTQPPCCNASIRGFVTYKRSEMFLMANIYIFPATHFLTRNWALSFSNKLCNSYNKYSLPN